MNKATKLMMIAALGMGITFANACDSDRSKATLQNSADTGNTREGQHHDIPVDTAKKDSTQTNSEGNVSPSGRGDAAVHPAH